MKAPAVPLPSPLARVLQDGPLYAGAFAVLVLLWLMMLGGQLNLMLAMATTGALALVLLRNPAAGALATLAYLHLLGDLRRLCDAVTGIPDKDLLLLVAPALTLLLAAPMLLRLRLEDTLPKAMLCLTVCMALQVFNPAQGGIAVGISGALFYLVPVLWFWIGRDLASPQVVERLLYRILFPLAVAAAVLGLVQTLVGFFPYEQVWIDATLRSYTALSLGGSTRPFGFSVSAAEYATLLELAAAGTAAAWFGGKRSWTLAFPLLLTAMLMASGRTVVVKLVLALAATWMLRARKPMTLARGLRFAIASAAGLAAIHAVASFALSVSGGPALGPTLGIATQESLLHLGGGLAHPFDARYSTLGIHREIFVDAIAGSLRVPLGLGLGATTGASTKFTGSTEVYSSEIDLSDSFVTLGPAGGLLYLFVYCAALRSAARYVLRTRLTVSLPVIAILIATVGAWLISGQYSTSALMFFLIGATAYRPGTENAHAVCAVADRVAQATRCAEW